MAKEKLQLKVQPSPQIFEIEAEFPIYRKQEMPGCKSYMMQCDCQKELVVTVHHDDGHPLSHTIEWKLDGNVEDDLYGLPYFLGQDPYDLTAEEFKKVFREALQSIDLQAMSIPVDWFSLTK